MVTLYNVSKRLIDIIGTLILLIAFLPFWVVIPILILLDSPGPIIFGHQRVGLKGKLFTM